MRKKTSNKISLKESIALNFRAFQLWYSKYPMIFISSTIYTIAGALTPYIGIYISAQLINELAGTRNSLKLRIWILISLITAILLSLLTTALSRWKNYKHSLLHYKKKKFYTDKMLDMDFCSLDEQHTHDLKSQIYQNDQWSGWGIGRIIGYYESLINSLISITGAVFLTVSLFILRVTNTESGLIFLNSPLFAALIILIMLTVTFLSPLCSNKANSYWTKRSEDAKKGNRFFGFFGFLAYDRSRALDIRMYRQEIICQNYSRKDKSCVPGSAISKYARGPMGIYNALSSVISMTFTGIVYVYVCLKSWAGAFGVGSVTQYIGAITALSGSVSSLISTLGDMRSNASFLRTTYEFLDIPNNMYQGSLTTEKRVDVNYDIEFRDVSFKYPSSGTYALRHVSIKFRIGERLAVVGQNGSGKTTFIKLLCRLYDPTEGDIFLNGINIKKYNYNDYMSIFSIVFQDFKLLSFNLGQNIAAKVDFDKHLVESCLDKSGFRDRLINMPKGINTYLYKDFDENGVEISGGEAQKVALARALYKDAPFIILDEPTAALDPIAEYEIYSKFNEIIGDKTAIYISHRLASCRFCDNIIVFENGTIIQYGSHNDLIKDMIGKYHELWFAQAQYYTEKKA